MARRSRRSDEFVDKDELIAAMTITRETLVVAMRRMSINGPLYRAASDLLALIDAVVAALGEDRTMLHARPHGGGGE